MTHSAGPADPAGPTDGGPTISLVVVNARVWTGSPGRPWADALAVRGGRLAAVGSSAEIRKLAGPAARVVDGRGGLVVAGRPDVDHRRPWRGGDPAAATGDVTLAAGAPADFILFDREPSGFPPAPPPDARILLRVVDGDVVAVDHP